MLTGSPRPLFATPALKGQDERWGKATLLRQQPQGTSVPDGVSLPGRFGAKVQCLGLAHTDQQEKNKLAKTLL